MTAIFNLTEPGEHPHCGDGLEKISGFPYLPETFMREGSECGVSVNSNSSNYAALRRRKRRRWPATRHFLCLFSKLA